MAEQPITPITLSDVDTLAQNVKRNDVGNLRVIRQQVLRASYEALETAGTFGYRGYIKVMVNGGLPLVTKVCEQLTANSTQLNWETATSTSRTVIVHISPKV